MASTALAVAASSWAVLMGIAPVLQIRRMLRERSSRDVSIGSAGNYRLRATSAIPGYTLMNSCPGLVVDR